MQKFLKVPLYSKYKENVNTQYVTMNIIDTVGIDECWGYNMLDQWIRESNIFLLVFDVTKKYSFEKIQIFYDRVIRLLEPEWNETHYCSDLGFLAIGNKCDLRDDKKYMQKYGHQGVDMDEAYEWFMEKQVPYIETSAKNGRNVNFMFRHCIYEYWIQSHSDCMPDYNIN